MGPIQWFLFVYVLGGLTFIPLLVGLVFLHAYYYLPPPPDEAAVPNDDPADIVRPADEKLVFKTGTDELAEKFLRRHDSDVAAGYFAVCREYVPGGVNGKPPDKLAPAGDAVAQESPSVYQTMYRSIFDRSQKPTIEPQKENAGKPPRRANNVFYVVLRHAHLMLYDDERQLDVRYVISLEYHDVDVYGDEDPIPEGELWIKRNSIRLRRKQTRAGDHSSSLPFFLFGESQSAKEDFYFAMLKNQEKGIAENPPIPQEFDPQDIVTLVQKLHSSEEHLQTRWLNAFVGRLFLAMYRTPVLENFLRTKLTKKISRVKKPTFITKIALRNIDLGTGGPFITNPRLKDFAVNGDCTAEADVNYSGNFRIEIAATARIDLGTRFKAREVEMLLAVMVKKVEGHVLLRCKPPPSNRLWFAFEKMPMIELALEPIVSSRQITYTVILKAIESRIREVVAESIVLPFWDDIPFYDTAQEAYRGGIWKKEPVPVPTTEIPNEEPPEEQADASGSGTRTPGELSKSDRVNSMPVLPDGKMAAQLNVSKRSILSLNDIPGLKSGDGVDNKSEPPTPRLMRSASFAEPADPTLTADHGIHTPSRENAEVTSAHRDSVTSLLKDLRARPATGTSSASGSAAGSPPTESAMASVMKGRTSSNASKESVRSTDQPSIDTTTTTESTRPRMTSTPSQLSLRSTDTASDSVTDGSQPFTPTELKKRPTFAQSAKSLTAADRQKTLASINAATAAAGKWGWGVIARNRQREAQAASDREQGAEETSSTPVPREPMGRGRPLPPPGMPLPPPERPPVSVFGSLKRKPVPPPLLPKRQDTNGTNGTNGANGVGDPSSAKPSSKPPLPDRRRRQSSMQVDRSQEEEEVLVVEAPRESAPNSPGMNEHHDEFFGHGETPAAQDEDGPTPPPLPVRRTDTPDNATDGSEEISRREIGTYA